MEKFVLEVNDLKALVAIIIIFLLFITYAIVIIKGYKKCPADKILVIYGSVSHNPDGSKKKCICKHGGATFVFPVLQSCKFLDLTPISFEINLKKVLSKDKSSINITSSFTIAISTEPSLMPVAAERLIGLNTKQIEQIAFNIICEQLNLDISQLDYEEVLNRPLFINKINHLIDEKISAVGLKLINLHIIKIS